MSERITGMQDAKLGYPAPDPLRETMRPKQARGVGEMLDVKHTGKNNEKSTGQTSLGLGEVAVKPTVLSPGPRTMPMSYDQQLKGLEERRLFIPF